VCVFVLYHAASFVRGRVWQRWIPLPNKIFSCSTWGKGAIDLELRLRACSSVISHLIQLIWQIPPQTPCQTDAYIYIPIKRQHFNLCIFIVMCMYSYFMFMYLRHASWHSSAALTEVFPCFFLSCKANARVKPAKMGHGPHSSRFLCCSMYSLFCVVMCIVCV
jgi:hypothetical protein